MKIDWTPFRELVQQHSTFAITSHVRPDADAIGSEIGLAHILRAQGKSVVIVNASPLTPNLRFLDPDQHVRQLGATFQASGVTAVDVHCIVDTSSWGQLGEVGSLLKTSPAKRVVIDHHASADDLSALEFKDVSREATGSLIAELAEAMEVSLTPAVASALFAAIATDTGWFRFSATTGETLRTVGRLIDAGASPAAVYRELYEQATIHRVHLAGRVLGRVTVECEGRLAYSYALWSDFQELGAALSDTEDLVNDCLRIAGTQVAFLAVEQPNGQVKFSFRSRSGVNVAAVAEQFQGGGHKQAAGAMLPGPCDAAVATARAALTAALNA